MVLHLVLHFSGDPTPIKYSVNDIQGNPVPTDGEIKIDYPPVAVDDLVSSQLVEPVTVKILDNDKNTSNPLDPESVSLVPPANATNIVRDAEGDIIAFEVNEGVWSVDELTGEVTFTPANSFTGGDLPAIAYTVQERDGKLVSNEASIKVNYATHILKAVKDGIILDIPKHITQINENYLNPHNFNGYIKQSYLSKNLKFCELLNIGYEKKMKDWIKNISNFS